jgi:hypothetical protein
MIAQDSECPSLMAKPTYYGEGRNVSLVPEADIGGCRNECLLRAHICHSQRLEYALNELLKLTLIYSVIRRRGSFVRGTK